MTGASQPPAVSTLYVLDANVFIAAWRDHYPPHVFPGLWEALENQCRLGRIRTIDRIQDEINSPPGLVAWLGAIKQEMIASSAEADVASVYGRMQAWAQQAGRYTDAAKEEFARVADCWLAAYANVHGATVVTNEKPDSTVRRRIPLPNVCAESGFDVRVVTLVDMLEELGISF